MVSGGEFGSTLSMILSDTVNGKVTWSHWEQTPTGQVAVFHCSVPAPPAHFEVMSLPPQRQTSLEGKAARQLVPAGLQALRQNSGGGSNSSTFLSKPGYHGSLWVDPVTGTIYAVTMDADTKGSGQFKRAAMMASIVRFRSGRASSFARCAASLSSSLLASPIWTSHPHGGRCADPMVNESACSPAIIASLPRRGSSRSTATAQPQDVRAQPGRFQEASPPADSTAASSRRGNSGSIRAGECARSRCVACPFLPCPPCPSSLNSAMILRTRLPRSW